MNCNQAQEARKVLALHGIPCNQVHAKSGNKCSVVVEPGTYTLWTTGEVRAFLAGRDWHEADGVFPHE